MQEVSINDGWFFLQKIFIWTKKVANVHQNAS